MTVVQALLIVLITWAMEFFNTWFSYIMLSQPLLLGPVVGLILGDFNQGLLMGATMQLVFLGVMAIGGTMPPNASLGTILGTAYAITMGANVETALAFAVPIAMLGSILGPITFSIRSMLNAFVQKLCESGNQRGIELAHILIALFTGLPTQIITFMALVFGAAPAEKLMGMIPTVITDGLNVASDMIPAVGIALLLRLMWNKNVAVWFFVGFILVSFLNLPLLAVACLGIVIAIVLFFENWSKQGTAKAAAGAGGAEEELFDD